MYNVVNKSFIFRDKYYGRQLRCSEFADSLRFFFENGAGLRLDVLPPFIEKVKQFRELIAKQNKYCFYSASLLLLYDGEPPTGVCFLALFCAPLFVLSRLFLCFLFVPFCYWKVTHIKEQRDASCTDHFLGFAYGDELSWHFSHVFSVCLLLLVSSHVFCVFSQTEQAVQLLTHFLFAIVSRNDGVCLTPCSSLIYYPL